MSMKADLLNPELGYFDEGENLTDLAFYEPATRPFGAASVFPPLTYCSKIFAELENEKLWTRSWVPIGLVQQIPNPGDLLPFTIGFHGVHVQRDRDGSISARFNRHQHGGCRFVPEQCRTGEQTKCSIASCNYTRDADVMPGGVGGEDTETMYKFVGVNPDKLVSVSCETWGSFIFINVDPGCRPLSEILGAYPQDLRPQMIILSEIRAKKWLDTKANWKHVGHAIVNIFGEISTEKPSLHWNGGQTTVPAYVLENVELPLEVSHISGGESQATLSWIFPNLVLIETRTHTVCTILQHTAMGKTLIRTFLLASRNLSNQDIVGVFDGWREVFRKVGVNAESLQITSEQWGTASLPQTSVDTLPEEKSLVAHTLQNYLASRILEQHHYSWSAPIMDATFKG